MEAPPHASHNVLRGRDHLPVRERIKVRGSRPAGACHVPRKDGVDREPRGLRDDPRRSEGHRAIELALRQGNPCISHLDFFCFSSECPLPVHVAENSELAERSMAATWDFLGKSFLAPSNEAQDCVVVGTWIHGRKREAPTGRTNLKSMCVSVCMCVSARCF